MNYKVWMSQWIVAIIIAPFCTTFGQSTTGSISGRVVDKTGAVIAGATVTVTNPENRISQSATSNNDGDFVIPQLPPGNYVIIVEKTGFKRLEKINVILSASDRLNAGDFALAVGGVAETISVEADAGQLQIQSESGERSDVITDKQIRNLAMNGRDLLDLLKILPGVVSDEFDGQISGPGGLANSSVNGTRGNQKEFSLDGSSNVDTGSNGSRHVTINPDAVVEVKVLSSNYSAEVGKAGGAAIQVVTKPGTKDYHGGARFFHRHEGLNANNYFNNARGLPRSLYRYNSFGYDAGGPLVIPGLPFNKNKDKVFFFWSQEYYRQLQPNGARLLRVPTLAEREGDFSQTTDGNGNRITVRDPTTPDRAAFPNNKIPRAYFFRDGQAILNILPLPNVVGNKQYNYISQVSNDYPRREDILRIDYTISPQTRLTGRVVHNSDKQLLPYGTFASGLNFPLTRMLYQRPGINGTLTLSHTFSPTLVNEFIFGPSRNRLTIAAEDDRASRKRNNITFPLLFPAANFSDYIPNFQYGGIANQSFPSTSFNGLPFYNVNDTFNFTDNLTKVWKNHTFKTGIFIQRSRKDQTSFGAINATINFSNDGNNRYLNTGHPYANALLGIYQSYQQASQYLLGLYRYTNTEAYIQDTWKIRRRLTLDLGLRVSWYQPQYEQRLQTGVFNPDLYDPSKAVRLYEPIWVKTANGSGQARAVDPGNRPANPTLDNTQSPDFIGRIVPNSGDLANGIGRTNQGYPRGGFPGRGPQWGPRVGFAYDIFGKGKTVLRGGFGISYDRIQGNLAFDMITAPPIILSPRLLYGRLDDLRAADLGPQTVYGFARDGKIPNVYSYSIGIQHEVGFKTVVDIAYVGTLSRHLSKNRNLNSIPYGTTFTRAAQDPVRFPDGVIGDEEPNLPAAHRAAGLKFSGDLAKRIDLLRPYPGYSDINYREFTATANYHSMQLAVRRRFGRGLTFGFAYTWSKTLTTANSDTEPNNPIDTRRYEYRLASFDRTHVFVANYTYELPKLSRYFGNHVLVRRLLDNWQISGITQFTSGSPLELGAGIAGIGYAQRVTGSYTDGPRFNLRRRPQPGPDGLQIDPDAFIIPGINDLGPWSRTYLRGPGVNNHDIVIVKNFPLGRDGKQYFQLRFEMFNAFNHTQFSGINTGVNLSLPPGSGLTGGLFNNYSRAVVSDNLRRQRPENATRELGYFFGEYNNARNPRIIQMGVKLYF